MKLHLAVAYLSCLQITLLASISPIPDYELSKTNCNRPKMNPNCASWISDVDSSSHPLYPFKTKNNLLKYADCVMEYLNDRTHYISHRKKHNISDDIETRWYEISDWFENALAEPPIPEQNDQILEVQIIGTEVQSITEDYEKSETIVVARTWITWNDTRVNWLNLTCFKLKVLLFYQDKLNSNDFKSDKRMIWRPNFRLPNDKEYRWMNLQINGTNGNILGSIESDSPMRCLYDYTRYPFDTVDCMFFITAHSPSVRLVAEVETKFQVDYSEFIPYVRTPPDWIVTHINEQQAWARSINKTKSKDAETRVTHPQVALHIQMKRRSQLPYTITAMMMAISATSGMFGPLTGNINGMKFTKLLSIATSVAGVMILALHNPKLYHSVVTPHIFVAFEFLMAVSLLSLLLSLTQYHLMGSITGKLPPPHKVKLISNLLNLGLFWIPKLFATDKEENRENAEVIGNCEIQPKKSYTSEWLEISNSLHRLLFINFFFIYFIGTIALCNF